MVIVGAGACGVRAALALRAEGYEGAVTLIGAEARSPYDRPPLSKPGDAGPLQPTEIASAGHLDEAGIAYLPGVAAMGIDRSAREVRLSDGRRLGYARLLLATGAQPRQASGVAARTFRTFEDARRLLDGAGGRRVVLIGAGLIGLELAGTLRSRGDEVTVVEAADRALGRAVLPELADEIVARHRRAGVDLRFGVKVTAVEDGTVMLDDATQVPADAVIAAIGVAPDTGLAADAGLEVADGIVVDATLRTADPAIFAAGDCAAVEHPHYGRRLRFEHWRGAQDQGEAAARNLLDAGEPFTRLPWFWSDHYELGLQVAGLPDPAMATVTRHVKEDARIVFSLAGDGTLAAASGLGPGTAVARDIRLAEMLIEKRAAPEPDMLSDPEVSLKKLARGRSP